MVCFSPDFSRGVVVDHFQAGAVAVVEVFPGAAANDALALYALHLYFLWGGEGSVVIKKAAPMQDYCDNDYGNYYQNPQGVIGPIGPTNSLQVDHCDHCVPGTFLLLI